MNKKILLFLTIFLSSGLIADHSTISYISFTYPYTGMVWEAGNNYTISWSSDATEGYTVDIKLYYNGSYETTIATGTWIDNNSQYYSWTVPDDITARTDYQIEICVSGSSCYYSDMFTINNSGTGGGDDDDGSIELLTNATEYGVGGSEQGYPINAWYHDVKHQSLYFGHHQFRQIKQSHQLQLL